MTQKTGRAPFPRTEATGHLRSRLAPLPRLLTILFRQKGGDPEGVGANVLIAPRARGKWYGGSIRTPAPTPLDYSLYLQALGRVVDKQVPR